MGALHLPRRQAVRGLRAGVPAVVEGATGSTPAPIDSTRLMVAGAGLFPPISSHVATAGQTNSVSELNVLLEDYGSSVIRPLWSNFWTINSGIQNPERDTPNALTVKASWSADDGLTWTPFTFDNGASSKTMQGGEHCIADAAHFPAIYTSRRVRLRTLRRVTSGDTSPGGYRINTAVGQGHVVGCRYTSDPAAAEALLTGGAITDNSTGAATYFYGPSMLLADGWDGRGVVLCVGDSIGFGRNAISWLTNGLRDTTTGKKNLPALNLCVQGTHPADQASTAAGQYRRRRSLLALAQAQNAASALPFTHILSEMVVNGVGTNLPQLTAAMRAWWLFLKAEFPGCPITQTYATPNTSALSNSGWTNYTNQQAQADVRFPWNAALAGELTAGRVDHLIDATPAWVGPDPYGQVWKTVDFATTLAADYPGSGPLRTVAAPPIGYFLAVDAGTSAVELCDSGVRGAAGSGPYDVTISGFTTSHLAGATVKAIPTRDGTHPAEPLTTDGATYVRTAKAAGYFGAA